MRNKKLLENITLAKLSMLHHKKQMEYYQEELRIYEDLQKELKFQ